MAGGTPVLEIGRAEKAVHKKLETRDWATRGSPLRELGLASRRADTWVRPYISYVSFSQKMCLRFNFAMIH